ncbi:cysteate racemase [Desulforhopalus sp. 52FAK]
MRRIGIIGGMGPEATLDLFQKIITNSPAHNDQEHLPILIDNNPQIPDRTAFLINGGADPLPQLVASAKKLQAGGVEAICMPCNTAHYFLEDLEKEILVPFISIIESTYLAITHEMPTVKKIGLFATEGTIGTRIYHRVFEKGGIELIDISKEDQQMMMEVIYGVKAGNIQDQVGKFQMLVEKIADCGAEAMIAGCTEFPLLLKSITPPVPFFDPTLILAKAVVAFSYSDQLSIAN